ncbi:hypothetical protein K458DRAFT_437681 [Lentithecium fluviatile CBS 122367]|uniref:Uncharacterized protein n=1 Tax=Lentithecium fluviatile CBS 122367 TaxID=1168545 RepID=A0A6G1ICS6_9PLEO|nr:hypothetical protein K458DRAFT_437681 [Lentithecium fluviatile CBS 122367]
MPPPPGIPQELADALNFLFDPASLHQQAIPKRTGFNRETINDLYSVDRLLPASTLYLFLDFAFEGNLYSGCKTTLPLVLEEEISLFTKQYAEWAPSPWNRERSSLDARLLDCPAEFNVSVSRKISHMRARLWEGMVPMSGARWNEKKLDDPLNWQRAFEFLLGIVKTFIWLGDPDISRGIKDNFNYVAGVLKPFEDALNARRAQNGVTARVEMRALWLEYMTDLFETMVHRTYTWLRDRIAETIAKAKAQYDAAADAKGAANCYEEGKKFLECWADLNRVHSYADFAIMMPLDGFAGFPSPNRTYSKVVGSMFPLPLRQDERDEMSLRLEWTRGLRAVEAPDAIRRSREDIDAVMQEVKRNDEYLRRELRGEAKTLGREHWIAILHSRTEWSLARGGPRDQRWGFVVYMLTHTPSESEWETFKVKLYEDFARSGQWVDGFEEVKARMDLQWVDAKEVGIPHDDVDAAKRHFSTFSTSPHCRRRTWKQDFFVIDTPSFISYTSPSTSIQKQPSYGDHGGFLTLIDTVSYSSAIIHQEAPGYQNKLRVLGSLVFDDVYPMVVSLVQRPRQLWPLAMRHPEQVYVGPVLEGQEKSWDGVWDLRGVWWRAFLKWRGEQGGGGTTAS